MSVKNIRQQIIGDEVDRVAELFGISEDAAFLRFTHHLLTGRSLHAFDDDDVVDGGQDKQIDVITIDADDSSADVWIIQAKNSSTFSSNALVQMGNGLRWLLFAPPVQAASSATNNKTFEILAGDTPIREALERI